MCQSSSEKYFKTSAKKERRNSLELHKSFKAKGFFPSFLPREREKKKEKKSPTFDAPSQNEKKKSLRWSQFMSWR
jgi:hypothetical protein